MIKRFCDHCKRELSHSDAFVSVKVEQEDSEPFEWGIIGYELCVNCIPLLKKLLTPQRPIN